MKAAEGKVGGTLNYQAKGAYVVQPRRKTLVKVLSEGLLLLAVLMAVFFRTFRVSAIIGNSTIQFLVIASIASAMTLVTIGRIRPGISDLWMFGFVAMCVLDGVLRTEYAWEAFEYWVFLLMFFLLKLFIQSDYRMLKRLIKCFYGCALFMTVTIFIQIFLPGLVTAVQRLIMTPNSIASAASNNARRYMTGLDDQSATAVWYCALLLAFAIAKLFNSRKVRPGTIVTFCIAGIAMMFTQKRSVLFASVMAGYAMYFLFSRKKNQRVFRIVIISLGLIVAAAVAYVVVPQVKYMIDRTLNSDTNIVFTGRYRFWDDLTAMFRSSPLFGVGGGTCENKYGFGGHNCYLQVVAEYGIVGGILFVGAFVVPFVQTFIRAWSFLRKYRYTKEAEWLMFALFVQLVFLIYCLTGNPLFDYIFFSTELICIGISQTLVLTRLKLKRKGA